MTYRSELQSSLPAKRGDRSEGWICLAGLPNQIGLLVNANVMRTLPQDAMTERTEFLPPLDDGREVVAGELASLACEHGWPVRKEKLHLAAPAGVKQDLARRRVAGVVLIRE